jgi:signal transduction histidine kinase
MNFFSISSLILSISSLSFGLIVYRSDEKSKVAKYWLYTSIIFAIWSFSLYEVTKATNIETSLLWQYLLDISAIFLPTLYFVFTSELLMLKNYTTRYIFYAMSFVVGILSITPYFKHGMAIRYGFYWINPGPLYFVFPVMFFIVVATAGFSLIHSYIKNKDDVILRGQIRNTLISCIFGFVGGFTNFFPQLFNVYPFGNYLVILFIVFMVYGVIRYKLVSAKVVSAQIFSVALLIVFLFNVIRAEGLSEVVINIIIFLAFVIFGLFLIQSVNKEIEARVKIEALAKELEDANVRLKVLDQQKSEFISLASHQLRGPLTAIKGYSSMLLEGDFGPMTDPVKDTTSKILQSTSDLVVLVGDYLDVSRIEQGRMQYNFEHFDLAEEIETVVTELKPTIEKAHLTISCDIDKNLNYIVDGDRGKLKQVIENIIDNSIKYTPQGSIHVWLTRKENNKILVTVSDTGVGIKAEVLPNLFEKFSRAPDASRTNIVGTGLGLYIAKKMIEAHHGRIWTESAGENKGASVFVELEGSN